MALASDDGFDQSKWLIYGDYWMYSWRPPMRPWKANKHRYGH